MRPALRDCPFCHTKGSDDEKLMFLHHSVICNDGDAYVSSYSIICTGCGVELSDEYEDDLVRLWNGIKAEQEDAEV